MPLSKQCPFCRSSIDENAKKCYRCQEWVSGLSRIKKFFAVILSIVTTIFAIYQTIDKMEIMETKVKLEKVAKVQTELIQDGVKLLEERPKGVVSGPRLPIDSRGEKILRYKERADMLQMEQKKFEEEK